jgi:HPt (histidine-containing phosphotransfer) domain-containing protein
MKLPGPASFDLQRFVASYRERSDILREILCIYREEAPERLRSIRDGIAASDHRAVAKAAHSLANTCGTLESMDGVQEARALEIAARYGEEEKIRESAGSLTAIVEAMLSEIDDYLTRDGCTGSGAENGHSG